MAEPTIHYHGPFVSKEDASKAGFTKFFTGKPCKKSHISQQFLANGVCCECNRLRSAAYYAANKAAIGIQKHDYARRRRLAGIDAERSRARRIRQQSERAGRPRPAVCDVCHEKRSKICFDHDHETGSFRGWLCDRCNRILGSARDDPTLLLKLSRYLAKFRPREIWNSNQLPLGPM